MFEALKDKRVLVVGGSSGLGLATARSFAGLGARVTIAARAGAKLETAAHDAGAGVEARPLDTTDAAAVERFFAVGEPWDHVAVTAAATRSGPVRALPLEDAYAAMDSKFWGAYRVARAVRIAESGSLTLLSGLFGWRPSPAAVLQGAINAAIEGLARGLALELAPVRVNVVSPGLIDTPIHDRLPADRRAAVFRETAERLPVRRIGAAQDVANAVVYLAATPFATGSTVFVDGGGALA